MLAAVFTASPAAPAATTAPAAVPPWVAVSGTVSAIITATGVLIAGAFANFKFIKGRIFHPRCLIDMDCQLVELEKARMLRVSISLRNESQIALLFLSEARQTLVIGAANTAAWRRAYKKQQPVRWEDTEPILWGLDVAEGEILTPPRQAPDSSRWRWLTRGWLLQYLSGEKLEPGEQWVRSALVPVAPDSVAFLLRAEVGACRHVALRHVPRHRSYCRKACEAGTPPLTWWREIYVLPGAHQNGFQFGSRPARNA